MLPDHFKLIALIADVVLKYPATLDNYRFTANIVRILHIKCLTKVCRWIE